MANINIVTRNFKGSYAYLNGESLLNVSSRAYFRAALTLGFQRFGDFWAAGLRSWNYRAGIAFSSWALLESGGGSLRLSDDHELFDASEKGVMSYWNGMIFAKLAAEECLGIPWLAHVDDMRAKGMVVTSAATKERGDFVGRDNVQGWHVIEAKGRSNQFTGALIKKAKKQASQVTKVGGQVPQTNSACITCLWKDPIEVILDDPPADTEDSGQLGLTDDQFWSYYYGNLANYIGEFGSERNLEELPNYRFAPLNFAGLAPPFLGSWRGQLRVGLPSAIVESPSLAPKAFLAGERAPNRYVGSDGIALVGEMTDWPEVESY